MIKCNYCKEEHTSENTGCHNSGDYNSGYYNSGNYNSGNYNSGNYNSGYRNSGYRNSGNCNSGDRNSGYRNSGDRNSGDRNSGDYNSGYRNSGWFNTNEPKMRFFNKESDYTYSEFSSKFPFVYPDLKICAWVNYKDLPQDEQNSDTKNMDGKLKTLTYKEAWSEYWNRTSEDDKKWFQSLPNFTWDVFTSITGIEPETKPEVKNEIVIDGVKYRRI